MILPKRVATTADNVYNHFMDMPIPPPMPSPLPPTPKKGMSIWIALVISVVVVAVYGAYAYYFTAWPFSPGATPTPTAQCQTPPSCLAYDAGSRTWQNNCGDVVEEPAGGWCIPGASSWKTYSDAQYGFSLVLTDAWSGYKVFTSQGSQGVGHPDFFEFAMPTTDRTQCVASMTDEVCGYTEIMRLTVYARDIWDGIGDARKFNTFLDQNDSIVVLGDASPATLPDDLKGINFTIPQVLSTFGFADTMVGWKTHTSEALNLRFQYPPDWEVIEGNDFPGSAQGEDYVRLWKGSDVIYAGTKTECLLGSSFCKSVTGGPSFSSVSTSPDVGKILDAVVKSATHIR